MTLSRPAAFPGGRVLAGWWKHLATWKPQSLWIGSISLERVEALCSIHQDEPLSPLENAVLNRLEVPTSAELLNQGLGIGQFLVGRVLAKLDQKQAVARTGQEWALTELGMQSRQSNSLPGRRVERRSFWFVGDSEGSGPQAFVAPAIPGAFQPVESTRFNRRSLEALLESAAQKSEWKSRRGFPLDVESIVAPDPTQGANDLSALERLVIVHPYRLQAALITYTNDAGAQAVAAFAYQEHGWALGSAPVFDVEAGWNELFPTLQLDPTEEVVTDAWRKWLAQRGFTDQALGHYRLIRHPERVGVVPPAELPDVLGAPRGDLARGEAWLILQEGPLRRAIPLEAAPRTEPGNSVSSRQAQRFRLPYARLSEALDQLHVQSRCAVRFRMPLDADTEPILVDSLDCLDDAVRGQRADAQFGPDLTHRLMMATVDSNFDAAVDLFEPRVGFEQHQMTMRPTSGVEVRHGAGQIFRQMEE